MCMKNSYQVQSVSKINVYCNIIYSKYSPYSNLCVSNIAYHGYGFYQFRQCSAQSYYAGDNNICLGQRGIFNLLMASRLS